MDSNPLEKLFKKRKEDNEKQDIETKLANETYIANAKEAIETMKPICISIHTHVENAVQYANSGLKKSRLQKFFEPIATNLKDIELAYGRIRVAYLNKDESDANSLALQKRIYLEFKADLDSKTIKISLHKRQNTKLTRDYPTSDVDLKNLVYTELAAFLENERIE